jgi:hypothetical protein
MVSARHASVLLDVVTAVDVETVVFCAVVEAVVLVDGFAMIAVAGIDVDETAEAEDVLAAVDAVAVVAAFDVVEAVVAFEAEVAVDAVEDADLLAVAGAAAVTAAGVAVAEPLGVVAGVVVELVAAVVVVLSDASDEPQPLSTEQHAIRPICTPIKTFPTLDTIVTHFHFCRVDGRTACGFGY